MYDYSETGAYFVTVCTQSRRELFGTVDVTDVRLTEIGQIVADRWAALPRHHCNLRLDAFVVMPNHVHGALLLGADRATGAAGRAPTVLPRRFGAPDPSSLSTIVGSFKSSATKHVNLARGTPGKTLWQRNYFEHVIRDDDDLIAIRQYIADNPAQWTLDEYHPARLLRTVVARTR